MIFLVIVHNFDFCGPRRAIGPLKANPLLIIDADAVLAPAVAHQGLKAITGQSGEVSQ